MNGVNAAYGLSDHYLGERGLRYFHWQSQEGYLNGEINSHKFRPYVKSTDVILDFGCGGGHTLAWLDCARKVGVEPNPHARAAAQDLGIECFESLTQVEDCAFDVVISNHVLEHIPYPIEALRQLKRKLKPGGLLVICLPMEDWRASPSYSPADVNHHLYAWNPQILGNAMAEAGFHVGPSSIRILTHCWPPRLHAPLYRHLPKSVFDWVCWLCALVLRRRQLLAVVRV